MGGPVAVIPMALLSNSSVILHRCAEAASALAAFALTLSAAQAAVPMSLSFSWKNYPSCEIESPTFRVRHVPAGTKRLAFNMVDEGLRDFPTDGATIPYPGRSSVPAGAFKYVGPCPDRPRPYRWTVKALAGDGKVLASASDTRRFPPP